MEQEVPCCLGSLPFFSFSIKRLLLLHNKSSKRECKRRGFTVKRKIVPLKPRGEVEPQQGSGETAGGPEELLQGPMQEVEQVLWRAAARAPAALRERLITVAREGERICPALFLLIAAPGRGEIRQTYNLAASLKALHLAMEMHRDSTAPAGLSPKEAILCGDFYFGLALTLAGGQPMFVQGMSEVITRFVTSSSDMIERVAVLQGQCKSHLQRICDGTASIYALSCTLGAWRSGLKAWQNEALSYYGLYLGIGLQVKREMEAFNTCLREKQPLIRAGLPVYFILGESPLRHKLASLLNRRLSERERDLFLLEANRVDPRPYLEQVTGNCFSKANHFIELMRENVDQGTLSLLKGFIS